ncbi:Gfo/Idh/MocA family oxidoreductase [Georgenia yuyongxinii]|uniref:Gfo/Idh/MocA family oxidoreductase n=1 Tax=Georgenia yuyongxinii TaxID=2589797 RepID=A0A5B8C373_9MICO|nr:Gfo/Idh/MocA family oxidoreductase [Georgenia yuyongxinii]QDC24974.1 Gfo/Idh/MocA family oxidoreductase [Georgenia yuyongxinii]
MPAEQLTSVPADLAPSDGVTAPVGFALVGAGTIARVTADAISRLDGAELRLVVDRSAASAAALADEYGAQWSDDVPGYLSAPAAASVDVVVVSTPSGSHADLVVPALEAAKDVLVEKPLEITLDAAQRIIDAEVRTGRVVGVVSQHRFDRASERVVDAVRSGRLGRLTSAIASCAWWRSQAYYDSSGWRGTWALDGGGAAMNQGIHVIDLMLAVMGDPVEVFAHTSRLAHERIEVEDTAVATVRFASGALGAVHATTAAYPGVETSLRIFGDRGSAAIIDDELAYFHVRGDGDAERVMGPGPGPSTNQATDDDRLTRAELGLGPSHGHQLRDMVRVVRARRHGDPRAAPRVGTREGHQALALILAMYESASTGTKVRIPAAP